CWWTFESDAQLAFGPRDLLLALDDVDGNANCSRLVRDAALHGLSDPPRRVRRELVAASPVELLDGTNEPDDPLLDQVEQRDPVTLVLLRDRDDEAKIGVDHQVLRGLVTALDALRELDLLLRSHELVAPRLVEEQLKRVGRRDRQISVDVGALRRVRARAIVRQRNVALLELFEEALDLLVVEVGFLQELVHGREVEAAELLALLEKDLKTLVGNHRYAVSPSTARG